MAEETIHMVARKHNRRRRLFRHLFSMTYSFI